MKSNEILFRKPKNVKENYSGILLLFCGKYLLIRGRGFIEAFSEPVRPL